MKIQKKAFQSLIEEKSVRMIVQILKLALILKIIIMDMRADYVHRFGDCDLRALFYACKEFPRK